MTSGSRRFFVALVLLAGGACSTGDGTNLAAPSSDLTSTTTVLGTSSTTTSTVATNLIPYERPGTPVELGTGLVLGTSLDGSAAYVAETDAAFPKPGCEGQPEPVAFRVPLEGGARQPIGTAQQPATGELLRPLGGPGGQQVALVTSCEEFLAAVRIATESVDGRLTDLRPLALPAPASSPTGPLSIVSSWTADGGALLAAANNDGKGVVALLDPATQTVSTLFDSGIASGVTQVGQLIDGTYVVAGGGNVTLRSTTGEVMATVEGAGFDIAPDGNRVVIFGRTLTILVSGRLPTGALLEVPAGQQIISAEFSPDGSAIAYVVSGLGKAGVVAVVTPGNSRSTAVPGTGTFGRAAFSGDGTRLVFNRVEPGLDVKVTVLVSTFGG